MMVDFRPEEIDLYLPHNLSNEDYHKKVNPGSLIFEKLCRRRGLSSATKATDAMEPCTKQTPPKVESAIPTTNGIHVTSPDTHFYLPPTLQSPVSDDREGPTPISCSTDSDSLDMANGSTPSTTDLSSYLNDIPLASPGAGGSDSETVFSDDYTVMTDVGEGSIVGDANINGEDDRRFSAASSEADSTYSASSLSSFSTVGEGEVGDSEEPFVKDCMIPKEQGKSTKHRPNIKLLLSHPQSLEDWQDTPSCSADTTPDSPEKEMPVTAESAFYEDREFDFLRTEPVKRSTSLKTYKTPPGTPHRKKAVRFADALGLDLESVRHILNLDEPPKVPASAMKDLQTETADDAKPVQGTRYLSANFPQPGASATFFQRVQGQKVLLENCLVDDKAMTITGTVRVANISYHKKVVVRFSTNNWLTHTDIQASYVQNSNDGPTDRFSFSISVPQYFNVGSKLQFCIQFVAGGNEFWDSNYGGNYNVECYAKSTPLNDADTTWLHFL